MIMYAYAFVLIPVAIYFLKRARGRKSSEKTSGEEKKKNLQD
jgi:hypothetical protein